MDRICSNRCKNHVQNFSRRFIYGRPVVFVTISKNSRQHNTPQLKTTLLLYYTTGFDCLNSHHQVSIYEIKT
jgi:hypothetical protein